MSERRVALKVLVGCAGAALGGAVVGPAATLVAEPGRAAGSEQGQWLRVARLDALEQGVPARANVVGSDTDAWTRAPDRRLGTVWLIRDGAAAVRAYSAVCPHLGCAIDLAGDHFTCPCHDSAFDLRGEPRTGPSPRGMDPIDVRLEDGWVAVRYRSFRLGVSERVEA